MIFNKIVYRFVVLVSVFSAFFVGLTTIVRAEPTKFLTPEAGVTQLISAFRQHDSLMLETLLGENPSKLIPHLSSHKNERNYNIGKFIKAYEQHHFLEKKGDEVILYVGESNWPFFIPMIKDTSEKWFFDFDAGLEELKTRKIGKNELFVMTSLNAYVDGQREFFRNNYNKKTVRTYARKFFSDRNSYNGLYWRKEKGKPVSPMGPYIAWAEQRGRKGGRNKPYSGYYYKILTKQGDSAEGGAYSYIVNDKMVFGFALIAWPADYGTSGIMSFIVNHHDKIYEKDLGDNTAEAAKEIDSFNPDETWSQVDDKWIDN